MIDTATRPRHESKQVNSNDWKFDNLRSTTTNTCILLACSKGFPPCSEQLEERKLRPPRLILQRGKEDRELACKAAWEGYLIRRPMLYPLSYGHSSSHHITAVKPPSAISTSHSKHHPTAAKLWKVASPNQKNWCSSLKLVFYHSPKTLLLFPIILTTVA
jgi:hypothetical protein